MYKNPIMYTHKNMTIYAEVTHIHIYAQAFSHSNAHAGLSIGWIQPILTGS